VGSFQNTGGNTNWERFIVNIVFKLTVVAATWLSTMTAVAADSTLDRIRSSSKLVIGYAIDICLRLADALARETSVKGLRIEYKLVTPSSRFDVLERGEADLECGSTTNNAKRRERVAFTIPHFVASARLMVRSSSGYERFEDLRQKVVASTKGTTNVESVAQHARLKGIELRVEASQDHAEGVVWVREGRVDAFAMDDVLLFGLRATSPKPEELRIIGKPITIEPYAIAFSRTDEKLKRVIDAEMRRLISSGELQKLYAKWFQSPIPPKGVNLDMRMPYLLSDSLKYPTDFVPH
jgi:ABC-type amino acid transport substrate-binding protein